MNAKIKLQEGAMTPFFATPGSAGMDVCAYIDQPITIKANGGRALISTGLQFEIEVGYEIQVRSRSGLALKKGVIVLNSPGTVDSDYRGILGVILINTSNEDFIVVPNERIAQIVFAKYETPTLEVVDELSASERGEGGFGHTGVSVK